ncbi:IPT/TIG domain-containing protein [Geomonas sp. Red69]|uniref:IPT/TIG domain-containing protein n=1 Tax=Geomonas diazotrophica TaxID=2843197 RepID=A0ABX8JFM5_9BACT|nr:MULTISPECIES: IPT/TIG domain-containing protein [Geomonas]MBU5636038.1 IPT/TIG domain-containing protein [Geomonas diazotrophica]QWV96786.1 IPT/TIG domain-containing protein [Geomonas nitrogeniifigens]QXE85886.1 IPT/TIG domain-containing protein [Geomonas nitrogeniifigens]
MPRNFAITLLLLLLCAAVAPAQQTPPPAADSGRQAPLGVLSILPAQGEPGTTVTLNGTGFTSATRVVLGSREIPAQAVGGRIMTFEIPELPPGAYALFLKREDGATTRPFNFVLQAQKPVVSSLIPDTVTSCATGREREVLVNGANFRNGTRVILDGAVVTTRFISPVMLAFTTPTLPAGMHQVQVRNPADALSTALALFIDAKPEIANVSVGREFVNYYELIVSGRNFQQNSVLVVDGKRLATGKQLVGEREQLVYGGCNQITYLRFPYDPTLKEITLQVVNQNGEESALFTISAP